MAIADRPGGGNPSVLVVGAGPVGMAAALELARRGAAVRIVDRNPARSQHSKAVGINARTLELLEPPGVTPALLAAGSKVRHMNLRYQGALLVRVDFTPLPHRHNFMLALAQSETERLLEAALAARGIAVGWGTALTGLAQDAAGCTATLNRDGSDETYRADYVVGADGAHSAVRKALGLGFSGERYPDDWSLADLRMDWPYGDGEANLLMHRDGRILFAITLGPGRFRIIANRGDAMGLLPAGARVHEVLWQSHFTVSLRQVARYREGRAFVVGDAAHIHSPAGGRGMNLGIEDAAVLADRLCHGGLDSFSADRHRVGAQVLAQTDRMFRLAAARNPLGRALRNAALRLLLRQDFVQARLRWQISGLAQAQPVSP